MMKNRKLKYIIILFLVFIFGYMFYSTQVRKHTFILNSQEGTNIKSTEISPVFSNIKVSSEEDTDLIFTDVKTGKTFTIGYLTPGMVEKIQLEKAHWYKVEARGNIKVYPVNIRIE